MVVGWYCSFYSNFNRIFCKKSGDLDQTSHFAASDLGLHCLHISHEKDNMLIWVKNGKTATKSFSWWVISHVRVTFLFKINI